MRCWSAPSSTPRWSTRRRATRPTRRKSPWADAAPTSPTPWRRSAEPDHPIADGRDRRPDRRLGAGVGEMQPVGIERQAHAVANLRAHRRLDRRHHHGGADLDVEQDLRSEFLEHLDHGFKAEFGGITGGGDAQILRTDAERDVVSAMAAQAGADVTGHL